MTSSRRGRTRCSARALSRFADHPLARAWRAKNPEIAAFVEECRRIGTAEAGIETAEKMGFDTGISGAHPFDPNWKLPVYVANFVLMGYGTGAIFGCPAHDQRDLEFARKYGLPVLPVVFRRARPENLRDRQRSLCRAWQARQFTFPRWPECRGGKGRSRQTLKRGQGTRTVQLSPARLAGVAPARLGLSDPDGPLRRMRRRSGAAEPICR